ncbi:mucin-2 isoform X2 [Patella vulgata]|uniref:mucin-2 isoform X2 n=1 Tax=Patella vulgata TaxID=6465 RepID=UPI00217F7750|nr:mucin-2 isoform X2 [Patella vulgata]
MAHHRIIVESFLLLTLYLTTARSHIVTASLDGQLNAPTNTGGRESSPNLLVQLPTTIQLATKVESGNTVKEPWSSPNIGNALDSLVPKVDSKSGQTLDSVQPPISTFDTSSNVVEPLPETKANNGYIIGGPPSSNFKTYNPPGTNFIIAVPVEQETSPIVLAPPEASPDLPNPTIPDNQVVSDPQNPTIPNNLLEPTVPVQPADATQPSPIQTETPSGTVKSEPAGSVGSGLIITKDDPFQQVPGSQLIVIKKKTPATLPTIVVDTAPGENNTGVVVPGSSIIVAKLPDAPVTTTTTTTTTTERPIITSTPSVPVPSVCLNGLGYVSHPSECTKFYQCVETSSGSVIATEFQCPRGLFWNSWALSCDYPRNVQCNNHPCTKTNSRYAPMTNKCNGYWLCKTGREPRAYCCRRGTSFDDKRQRCVRDKKCRVKCRRVSSEEDDSDEDDDDDDDDDDNDDNSESNESNESNDSESNEIGN